MFTAYSHLLTIIWGQQNEKGNGGSPDPFFSAPSARVKKKGSGSRDYVPSRGSSDKSQ